MCLPRSPNHQAPVNEYTKHSTTREDGRKDGVEGGDDDDKLNCKALSNGSLPHTERPGPGWC